jgi:phosphoglycerate dehydrogenase-like enzyme
MKSLLVWTGGDDGPLCEALATVPGIDLRRAASKAEAVAGMADADGMIASVIPWDADLARALRDSPRLKWLQVLNTGFDNLEALGLPAGLQLSTLGELGSPAVVEHAMGLLLALCRGLHRARDLTREGRWEGSTLRGGLVSLHGRRVAVLGMGPIGLAVARALRALGAEPVGIGTRAREEDGIAVRPLGELHEVLAGSTAVVVCAPLKRATTGLLDAAALASMPRGGFLVNISRGAIVDTPALCAALDSGQLAGAGLDVTDPEPLPSDHPLWKQPGLIITPHVAWAGSAPSGQQQRTDYVVANLRRFADGERPGGLAAFEALEA